MDKKYYSNRHKSYNRKKDAARSAFLMRLNISLGIAIAVIGIYKLDNDFSKQLTTVYKGLVADNISFEQIKKDFYKISSRSSSAVAYEGDGSISLDESTIEYINNIEDNYAANNTPAVAP